jgi:hypothetical protein
MAKYRYIVTYCDEGPEDRVVGTSLITRDNEVRIANGDAMVLFVPAINVRSIRSVPIEEADDGGDEPEPEREPLTARDLLARRDAAKLKA